MPPFSPVFYNRNRFSSPPQVSVEDAPQPQHEEPHFMFPEQPNTPSLDRYRSALETMPTRESYAPRLRDKILAALVAGGTGFTSGAGAGMQAGRELLDRPYNRAREDWKGRLEGLGEAANVESKGISGRNQYFRDYNSTVKDVEDVKARKAAGNLDLEQFGEVKRAHGVSETAKLTDQAEEKRHHRAEEATARENASTRAGKPIWRTITDKDPNSPSYGEQLSGWFTPGSNEMMGGTDKANRAPATVESRNIQESSRAVKLAIRRLRADLPAVAEKIGPISGTPEAIKEALGASKDPDLRRFALHYDTLEKSHAKIYGRSSVQMMAAIRKSFGSGLRQNKVQFEASLDALEDQADDFITARKPDANKNDPNKETGKERKTKSGATYTREQ